MVWEFVSLSFEIFPPKCKKFENSLKLPGVLFSISLIIYNNKGLNIIPTIEDIENADYSRGEVFAQSFSYILGGDDGNKEEFIKTFPNTYKIVEKYVNSMKL